VKGTEGVAVNVFKVILAVILVIIVFEVVLGIVGVVASTLGFVFEVAIVVALCLLAYRFFQKR
jgi:hypothetical protein